MTITVELKSENVLALLLDLERLNLLKLVATKPRPRFGSAKGMFVMAPDFDEPLEDFKEYMY